MAITSEAIGIGQALGPGRSWKKPWLPRGCIASSPGSSRGEGWGEGLFSAQTVRDALADSPSPDVLLASTSPRKRGQVQRTLRYIDSTRQPRRQSAINSNSVRS